MKITFRCDKSLWQNNNINRDNCHFREVNNVLNDFTASVNTCYRSPINSTKHEFFKRRHLVLSQQLHCSLSSILKIPGYARFQWIANCKIHNVVFNMQHAFSNRCNSLQLRWFIYKLQSLRGFLLKTTLFSCFASFDPLEKTNQY